MRRRAYCFLMVWGFLALGTGISSAASTATPTRTCTMTPTETVLGRVTINHNRFNPLLGERLEVQGLSSLHGKVTITVFTQSGIFIKTILSDEYPRGNTPVWDGKNEKGAWVASGVYVIVVQGYKLHKRFRVGVLK